MVIDSIQNASLYNGLGENITKALKYLSETKFEDITPGRYKIDGDHIFALVQEYLTKSVSESLWETHRRYIDIQYIVSGIEQIGFSLLDDMTVKKEYNSENDFSLLEGNGYFFSLQKNMFTILWPHDAHMPGLNEGVQQQKVKKVVVKVRI